MTLINNKVEYVSLHTAISDFYEDNGIQQHDINESLLEKWAMDKVDDIGSDRQLTHSIAWLTVNNYKAEIPKGLTNILEVAYRIEEKQSDCSIKGYQIVQMVQDTHEGCQLEMNVLCPSCHKSTCNCATEDVIVDINTAWEIAHPEVYYDKYLRVGRFGYGTSIYDPGWKLLCHTDNDWFGLNKHIPGCANLYCKECPETYRIQPPIIETSFEKGEILLSYMGRVMDKNGVIMIPKHRDVFEAVLQYLTYKWYRREYLMKGRAIDRNTYVEAKQLCDEATTKAISRIGMPSFEEFSKFWSNNKWVKMDSAYSNLLKGGAGVSTIKYEQRNIYKS